MMYIYLFVFILGAVIASFIHVYVTRLLKGESLIKPRSHCTECLHILKWYELIPIVSYLVQSGKCRVCNKKIGKDVFLVELITGILFVIVYLIFGFTFKTLLGFVIVMTLISVCISDFKEMIILDSTLIASALLSYIIIFIDLGLRGIYKSFLYGIFAFVLFFVIKIVGDHVFKRECLGGGDIKLAFVMGSILPYNLFLFAILISSVVALPYALVASRNREFAYGPFLVIGLFIVFLMQNEITKVLELLIM